MAHMDSRTENWQSTILVYNCARFVLRSKNGIFNGVNLVWWGVETSTVVLAELDEKLLQTEVVWQSSKWALNIRLLENYEEVPEMK